MCFYLIFSFFGFNVADKRTMNLFKGSEVFEFSNFICRIEKHEIWKIHIIKNAYPPFLIDKFIKKHLNHKFSSNKNQFIFVISDIYYFKLPYIGNLSHHFKKKFKTLQRIL